MSDETAIIRLEATVAGRVHGVGFRYFVLAEALALGLVGWVANLPDGSVRCVAEGPRDRVERLAVRLREGPPAAVVDRVDLTWLAATGALPAFEVHSGAHSGD